MEANSDELDKQSMASQDDAQAKAARGNDENVKHSVAKNWYCSQMSKS